MEKIAFIYGNTFIYWNSVVMTMAVGVAICLFLAFYLPSGKKLAAAVAVPLALVLSVFFGRLFHWYFRPDGYTGFVKAMTDYMSGGYALMGCFAACGATAGILKLVGLEKHPMRMLDAMSLGGCAGICVGRLACFFSAAQVFADAALCIPCQQCGHRCAGIPAGNLCDSVHGDGAGICCGDGLFPAGQAETG